VSVAGLELGDVIAALLGHRSPRMTLVDARISDSTVAEQYFAATSAVEAAATTAPTTVDGSDQAAARLHRRLLGNGHCTRPLELDCRFQTTCEGCGFYETGPEFVTILRRHRDDAAAHTDPVRTHLYNELIRVIDDTDNDRRDPRHQGAGDHERIARLAREGLDTAR